MTKGQKQDILHRMEGLYAIHKKIAGALEQKDMESVQQLLLECQECGIHIGNRIEASEGEGFVTVSCLEAYCEGVYQVYAGQYQAQNAEGFLNESLDRVKESIRKDIVIRKEAVFLPYKASMWDSLESVWRKKKADPGCDVYVIPIPYYDKNPDGSFREKHYEGDWYPDGVEITDYQNYSIEERRPDEIYIHNPYDAVNFVTSVEPRYYASNLKKYTDKLIYIPYFILEEIQPDDQKKINTMRHFCLLPGVIHATQVIVQSENMRQIYINELMDAFRERGVQVDRAYWENKICGTGSPKVIKVLHTRKEDEEIPVEWLKIIQKRDGTWKKVIFYNIGVNALLQYGEKLLKKVEYVFEEFKKHREDIAVLWRPHPLMESALVAQKPYLLEWYHRIRTQYREAGWGIYDDTADLNRAIAISDVYFGDASSVSQLFKESKKKVIIQNVNVCNLYGKNLIGVYDIVEGNGKKYFTSKYMNGLFCYDQSMGKVEFLQRFQTEQESFLYMIGYEVDEFIFFAPYMADNIAVYDTRQKKMHYLYEGRLKEARIVRIIEYKKKIFLINESSLARSYVFDIKKMKLLTLPEAYDLSEETLEDARVWGYRDICLVDESIYLPGERPDCVIEFNLEQGNVIIHKISNGGMTYVTIAYDGTAFWLTSDQRSIVRWNKEKEIEILKEMPAGFSIKEYVEHKGCFACSLYMEGYAYFFPLSANMIIRVNVKSRKIEMIKDGLEEVICWCAKTWSLDSFFVEADEYEGEIIRDSFVLNMQNKCIEKKCLRLGRHEEREKVKETYFKNSYFASETTEMEVMDLL